MPQEYRFVMKDENGKWFGIPQDKIVEIFIDADGHYANSGASYGEDIGPYEYDIIRLVIYKISKTDRFLKKDIKENLSFITRDEVINILMTYLPTHLSSVCRAFDMIGYKLPELPYKE